MRLSWFTAVSLAMGIALVGTIACKKKDEQPPAGKPTKGTKRSPMAPVPKLSDEERKLTLAEVNGMAVTKGDFHDRIHRQSVFNRRRYTKLARKKQYLEREFIMPELEYGSAQKKGLQKDAYVQRTLKNLMVSKLMRKLRSEFKTSEPSEAELQAYYAKHKDDYNQPELVRVSHILLKDEATAKKVAAKAKGKSRVEFRRLVQKHSQDQGTKTRAGDLRYFDRQGKVRGLANGEAAAIPKSIVDAAWALKKQGQLTGPIKSTLGWHVIYFTGRRPARTRNFKQARLHVKKRMMRDRWQEQRLGFIKKLKAEFKASVPAEAELKRRLGLVKVDLKASAPRAHGPGGRPPGGRGGGGRGHGHGHGH